MKIVQTKDYLLWIDKEAEIKEGNYYFANQGVKLCKEVRENDKYPYLDQYGNYDSIHWKGIIIAYYPLTKEAKELDLPLLPPFEKEIDMEELFYDNCKNLYDTIEEQNISKLSFYKGYKAAQQSNKQYSLEDVKKAIEMAGKTFISERRPIDRYSTEEIIQSLSTQQLPKEFIPEYEDGCLNYTENKSCNKPCENMFCQPNGKVELKTITNSEGKEVLCGTYKY